jgi:hypothetical protein
MENTVMRIANSDLQADRSGRRAAEELREDAQHVVRPILRDMFSAGHHWALEPWEALLIGGCVFFFVLLSGTTIFEVAAFGARFAAVGAQFAG